MRVSCLTSTVVKVPHPCPVTCPDGLLPLHRHYLQVSGTRCSPSMTRHEGFLCSVSPALCYRSGVGLSSLGSGSLNLTVRFSSSEVSSRFPTSTRCTLLPSRRSAISLAAVVAPPIAAQN